jgi:hypothetical protein
VITPRMKTIPTVQGLRHDKNDDDRRKAQRDFDRRRSPRRQVFKVATISWHNAPTIHCVVRDISDGGACLEIHEPVPDSFVLILDDVPHTCRVVWRYSNRVGLEFLK